MNCRAVVGCPCRTKEILSDPWPNAMEADQSAGQSLKNRTAIAMKAISPTLGCAKLSFLRLSFISFLFRIEHLYFCPNGATVLPALGNAQGTGARVEDFRPNGPTNRPRGMVGPLGRHENRRATAPLGVAQGWENGWAFGPSDGAADGTQRALLLSRSLSKFAKFCAAQPNAMPCQNRPVLPCLLGVPCPPISGCPRITCEFS